MVSILGELHAFGLQKGLVLLGGLVTACQMLLDRFRHSLNKPNHYSF